MNTFKSITRLIGASAAALLIAAIPQQAFAVASNVEVANTATVDYKVGGIDQTQKSASVSFWTDKKVDILVEDLDGAAVLVVPGQTFDNDGGTADVVLAFRVTNQGNDTQDVILTPTALSGAAARFGGTDNFDVTSLTVYIDDGNGSWDGTGTESTHATNDYIDNLAAGANKVVFLVGTVPLSQANGDIASYYLKAQIALASGSTASPAAAETATGDGTVDNPTNSSGTVADVVFADTTTDNFNSDADRDGFYVEWAEWKVSAASLTITKGSIVVKDGVSASNFKRIPGAIVEYFIEIDNSSGAQDATNIIIIDDLNTEIATNGNIAFVNDAHADAYDDAGTPKAFKIVTDFGGANTTTYRTGSTGDADNADFNNAGATRTNKVWVNGLTVAKNTKTRVYFQVEIQ